MVKLRFVFPQRDQTHEIPELVTSLRRFRFLRLLLTFLDVLTFVIKSDPHFFLIIDSLNGVLLINLIGFVDHFLRYIII